MTENPDVFTDLSDEEEKKRKERAYKHKSEKGRRMAKSIAEHLLMRYFFPDMKDRKKQAVIKSLFTFDMQFNLASGLVTKAT